MAEASPMGDSITAGLRDSITAELRAHMQSQGITSFRGLAQAAGISEGQIMQFRRGNAPKMRLEMLQKLAAALQLDLAGLLSIAEIPMAVPQSPSATPTSSSASDAASDNASDIALKAEYDRLQQQLTQQEAELQQRFQQDSLYALEAWMKNWPRVVHAVQTDKPNLAAAKILPLIKPLEQLLQSWQVEMIGCIGKPLPYDPQAHQLVQGQAQPGEEVTVARPGYRHGDRLLHRAEVRA